MPTPQQVRDALDRHGVAPASSSTEGYHVEPGPSETVIVRWGSGEPFRPHYGVPGSSKLRSCARAVTAEGFRIVPDENGNPVRADRSGHHYLLVADRT
jgi:hypothetical protein